MHKFAISFDKYMQVERIYNFEGSEWKKILNRALCGIAGVKGRGKLINPEGDWHWGIARWRQLKHYADEELKVGESGVDVLMRKRRWGGGAGRNSNGKIE